MDPKRAHSKTHQSSSDSNSNSPASPSSPALGVSKASPSSPALGVSKASAAGNVFANDGSFMEMFKKKMEEERRKKELLQASEGDASTAEEGQSTVEKKPPAVTSFVGKRRGGVFLKTGMVAKKQKPDSENEPGKSDAWSQYMAEVKKYKAHQCGDDDKTRPLVK